MAPRLQTRACLGCLRIKWRCTSTALVLQPRSLSASERGFSFVVSHESSSGPGLRGRPGFLASRRPILINRPAIRVGGSPFKTFADAEHACEAILERLAK